jgi:hypothetical protein
MPGARHLTTPPRKSTGKSTRTATLNSQRPPRIDVPTGAIADALTRGRGLTDRDHRVIGHLAQHRVLTALHVARLEFGSYSHARSRLAQLHRRGILARFRRDLFPGAQAWRYTLGHTGAVLHAAATNQPLPRPAAITETVLRLAHSSHTEHLLGVNTFFTSLVGYARTHPGHTLELWWPEPQAARHCGGLLRPDGYATYTCPDPAPVSVSGRRSGAASGPRGGSGLASGVVAVGESGPEAGPSWLSLAFFYEHDNGTESLDTLVAKIARYGELADAGLGYPVLIRLPTTVREHHLHAALARRWPSRAPVPVATLPADQLAPTGPAITPASPSVLDALWLPVGHHQRRTLTQLATRSLTATH